MPDLIERQPLPPGTLLQGGQFRIESLLGAGGFALTYRATQGRWNLAVCIKEYFPDGSRRELHGIEPVDAASLQSFFEEGQSLARFNHSGIVRMLGTFSENNTIYLVQELLEGLTLADGLNMAGQMNQSRVLEVAQQLGQALLMVHAAGLVHSDIKPENLFLTRGGRYVLLDFGLTRGFLSAAQASLGGRGLSSGYAPPEQYEANAAIRPETDVYGLAATMYCLLAGMAPPDAMLRKQGQPIPDLTQLNHSVSPKVLKALRNALELDPRQRTPGIREFLHQLELDSTPKAVTYRSNPFELQLNRKAHPTGITALTLHSAQERLYSAGRDGTIKSWSWPDLQLVAEVKLWEVPISDLTVSPDGNYLCAGSTTGDVQLLSSSLEHSGITLDQQSAAISALQFSGDCIAVASVNGSCSLLSAGKEPVRWVAHAGSCNTLAFHPDGSFLATAGDDCLVRFWELPEPQVFSELKGHQKGIQSLAFGPDRTTLLTASNDGHAKFWDLISNQVVRDFTAQGAMVLQVRYTCFPGVILTLSGDHNLRAFSLSSSRVVHMSEVRNERTRCLACDPELPLVATSSSDGSICVWDFGQIPLTERLTSSPPERLRPKATPDEVDPMLGRQLAGYRILELLGAGGMAKVYRAECSRSERLVAIKVLRPDHVSDEFLDRFRREISLSQKLNHPNVLRTLNWGQEEGITFLVMELIDGQPLNTHIPPEGLPLVIVRDYVSGLVAALEHAHDLGIVHRDLKPENVMITLSGEVKLMDFGLARDREVKTVTKLGSALGTAAYMAPEQVLRGPQRSDLTEKTDQYALGILVFELLTGHRPFEWNDLAKLIVAHVSATPPTITSLRPDLPEGLDAVVSRMLAKDPDHRYPSVRDAGEALIRQLTRLPQEL